MRPRQPERYSHDYERRGTLDLFAALDGKTGTVVGSCQPRHRSAEFRAFLDTIDARPRFRLHFTPTSSSWLNLVEGWFAPPTQA